MPPIGPVARHIASQTALVPATPAAPMFSFMGRTPNVPGMDQIWADVWPQPWRGPLDTDNFSGETPVMRRMYRALYLREPALRAAIEGKINAVASLDVTVNAEDEKNPNDVAYAKLVDWMVRKTRQRWSGLIRSIGLAALIDGYSITEKTLKVVESGPWDGFKALKHCKTKDTEHLRLHLDQFRNVTGIVSLLRGAESFDPKKVILHTHADLFDSPFGRSDIRAAFRACNLIEDAYKLWHILLSTTNGPFLRGHTSDTAKKPAMEQALAHARALGYIVTASSGSAATADMIELLNFASTTNFQAFENKVRILREEIFFTVRGAYLPFLQGSGTGGDTRGDAGIGKTVGSDPMEYLLAQAIESSLEHDFIPDFADDFPPGTGTPSIELGGTDWAEMKARLDVVNGVREKSNLDGSRRWYRKIFQYPGPEDPDDVLPPSSGQGGPGGPGMPGLPAGPVPGNPAAPPALPPAANDPSASPVAAPDSQPAPAQPSPAPASSQAPAIDDATISDTIQELLDEMMSGEDQGEADDEGDDANDPGDDEPDDDFDIELQAEDEGDGEEEPEAETFAENHKSGVYKDKRGRRYRLANGKRVPLGDAGKEATKSNSRSLGDRLKGAAQSAIRGTGSFLKGLQDRVENDPRTPSYYPRNGSSPVSAADAVKTKALNDHFAKLKQIAETQGLDAAIRAQGGDPNRLKPKPSPAVGSKPTPAGSKTPAEPKQPTAPQSRQWADKHAATHAGAVAAHLGMDRTEAQAKLASVIHQARSQAAKSGSGVAYLAAPDGSGRRIRVTVKRKNGGTPNAG